mgnify:CR=1 FL=1
MSDSYQIEIPQSFIALFLTPGSQKPNAAREQIAARYDLCEDLATLLVEVASTQLASSRDSTAQVLQQCQAGLLGEAAMVSQAEAEWVIRRLAELLNWEPV